MRIVAADIFVPHSSEDSTLGGASGSIQRAVHLASSGDTIYVQAGAYVGPIEVDQSLTLFGAKSGVNANDLSRGTGETILSPADAGADLDFSLVHVAASNVTIDGLTLDGAVASGPSVNLNGVASGAYVGITNSDAAFHLTNVSDVHILNDVVQNLVDFGVDFDSDTGGTSSGNELNNNKFDNLPAGDPYLGTGILLSDNFSADVTGNILTRVFDGIVINHYGDVGAGTLAVTGNRVQSSDSGIDLLDDYAGGGHVTITGNTATTVSGSTTNRGLSLEGVQTAAQLAISGNDVTGAHVGVFLWDNPGGVTISGGTLSGNDDGVVASNYDERTMASATEASAGEIQGVTITGSTVSGISIQDDPHANPSRNAVTLTVDGGTSMTGVSASDVGILVSGPNASAAISDSSIQDVTVGVEIDGGSATISGSLIELTGTGISVHGGGGLTLNGNTITLSGVGVEVGSTGTLASATGNRIDANTGDGIRIDAGTTSVSPITNNDLSGNGGLAVDNLSGLSIDASLNWWGVNTEPAVAAETHGSVDYTPWFDTGTNSAAGPAFSGDHSKLDVGSGGTQVQAGGRINEAIGDSAGANIVIKVYDGTYTEDVLVNKNLTLESVNGAAVTTINDPISASVTVAANVTSGTLSGITIEAGSGEWALDILGTGMNIVGNLFESLGLGNVLAADGGNIITGNTFTAPPVASETDFEQFDDTSAGRENSGEITGLLAANTFNRGVSVHDASGYVRTIWADIQPAAEDAAGGDTVTAVAGMYSELVTVDKSITLLGAQHGVAAPSRAGAESVINSPNGVTELTIAASDATVDGFTIEGNTSGSGGGAAMRPGIAGTEFLNNIVEDNISGLELANASGADQAVISGNLFRDNTNPGAGSGRDIAADNVTAGGVVQNVLIENNMFTNSSPIGDSWGIAMANVGSAPFSGITVEGNAFSNTGRGMSFDNSTGVIIDANTVSGATQYAVGLFGDSSSPGEPGNSGPFVITRNTLDNNGTGVVVQGDGAAHPAFTSGTLDISNNYLDGNATGLALASDGLASGVTVAVNINHIAGNPMAGLENDSTVTIDARNNWWGDADGPNTPLNTDHPNNSAGDTILGTALIAPWLTDGIDSDASTPGFQHAVATPAVSPPAAQNATEGAPQTIVLGSFTDRGNPGGGPWSVDVRWGDGSPDDTFTVMNQDASNPVSLGSQTHTYAEEGSYTVTLTVTAQAGTPGTANFTANVADAPLSSTPADLTPPSAIEGAAFGPLTVFHFTDADPAGTVSDYVATVNTGDATLTSSANPGNVTIVADGGGFDVRLSYTYAEDLTGATFSVSVTDQAATTSQSISTFSVAEGVLSFTAGTPFGTVEGNDSGTQTVANFSDTGLEPATAYGAVIHWGDGQDSAGVVAQTSAGHFTVTGDHTYAEEGSYNISVTITDDVTHVTTSLTTDLAKVSEGVVSIGSGIPFTITEGSPSGTQTVATFSDTGLEPASGYAAVIHWGVGQESPGVVTQTSPGHFAVTGSYTYAEEGLYNISVTITDERTGTSNGVTDMATVTEGVLNFTAGTAFTAVEGNDSGPQTVANFSDTGLEPASDYSRHDPLGRRQRQLQGRVTQHKPGPFYGDWKPHVRHAGLVQHQRHDQR